MPAIATYSAAVAIGFLILTTVVMLWFTFTDQDGSSRAPPSGEDADATE